MDFWPEERVISKSEVNYEHKMPLFGNITILEACLRIENMKSDNFYIRVPGQAASQCLVLSLRDRIGKALRRDRWISIIGHPNSI